MGAIAGRNFSVQENLKKFTKMKHLLISLVLVCVYLNTATGHCCGHCVPALCSCFQTEGGCDTLPDGSTTCPPDNSHLCCAPSKCGDCNVFCCECSCCCSRSDGTTNSVPAIQKWNSVDKNRDLKLDEEELSLYLEMGAPPGPSILLTKRSLLNCFWML